MKAIITAVFNRKKQLNGKGLALVQMRIYTDKNHYLSTGIYCSPQDWNSKKSCFKKDDEKNLMLDQLRAKIQHYLSGVDVLDIEKLKSYIQGKSSVSGSFLEYCREYLQKRSASIASATVNNHESTLKLVEKWQNEGKKIEIMDFTVAKLYEFEAYCLKNGMAKNSIARHHEVIRFYLNEALKEAKIEPKNYPYTRFTIKREQSERMYLQKSDISLLETSTLLGAGERVKDLFLFACYTGLRFADIQKLQKSDIQQNEGEKYIVLRNEKTAKISRLNISKLFKGRALELLEKYNYDLPKLTNVHVNHVLKMIASDLGLQKKLHFHIARHTFATYLLNEGLDLPTLQSLLNHASISTTQIYAKIQQSTINQKLDLIFDK